MSKGIMFVMHRNHTLASTMGHTIEFKKGEPTYVPKELYQAAQAVGAVPADELEEDEVKPKVELDPEDRKALIAAAIAKIVLAAERESFTGNGSPHAKAISDITGFPVTAGERDTAWADFRQANQADA